MPAQDPNLSASTLKRIRALSRPITILLTIALGLLVVVTVLEIAALLFGFHHGDPWQAQASFSEAGFGLRVFEQAPSVRPPGVVAVETLDMSQRVEIAALAIVCAGCTALTLLNLRQLFAVYSKGEVFSSSAVGRMKGFALWLVLAAIAVNICGRVFVALTGAVADVPANVLLAAFLGAMIYVIAHVMQLACEADEERREFV